MGKYNITYPYYCKGNFGIYAILAPKEMLAVEGGGGTGSPGLGVSLVKYISRPKIIKIFQFSKQITESEFQLIAGKMIANFLGKIPGAKIIQQTEIKQINQMPDQYKKRNCLTCKFSDHNTDNSCQETNSERWFKCCASGDKCSEWEQMSERGMDRFKFR